MVALHFVAFKVFPACIFMAAQIFLFRGVCGHHTSKGYDNHDLMVSPQHSSLPWSMAGGPIILTRRKTTCCTRGSGCVDERKQRQNRRWPRTWGHCTLLGVRRLVGKETKKITSHIALLSPSISQYCPPFKRVMREGGGGQLCEFQKFRLHHTRIDFRGPTFF